MTKKINTAGEVITELSKTLTRLIPNSSQDEFLRKLIECVEVIYSDKSNSSS